MNGSRTMPACLAIALVAAGVFGQTTQPVVTWSPSGSGNANITWNQSGNGWNVQLNRTNSSVPISVTVTSLTTEPIRFVLLNQGSWPYMTTLRVRGPSSGSPCGRVDSITAFDSGPIQIAELRVEGTLGYNLSSGDDAVQGFDNVGIVRVTGDVLDSINAYVNISDCVLLGDVYGSVIAEGGDITTLIVGSAQVQGNLYGDVEASNGDIKTLEVLNGDIGTAQSPVSITAGEGSADRIEYINVPAGDIHANITAYNIFKSGTGDEGIHVTGSVADSTITLSNGLREDLTITGGDFAASARIDAMHITDGADIRIQKDGAGIGGSMLGDMYFTGAMDYGIVQIDRTLAGTLSIGRSLDDHLTILGDPASGEGLTGQVIVNASNGSYPWSSGVVTIGPSGSQVTLSPVPYYNQKSSTVGGGAVGLVPYYCHYKDCTPVATKVNEASDGLDGLDWCTQGYHASRKGVTGTAVDGPIIRHYGPIGQAGTGKPFTVKEKAITDASCNWMPVTSAFTHTLHPSGDERAIEIDGPFMPGFDYLIEPMVSNAGSDYLYCGGLSSTTVGLKDYDFRFRVFVLQDLNLSGGLETDDITTWINDPVDTTLDGVVDNADLIDVTEAVVTYGG